MDTVCLNGEFLPLSQAMVSVTDAGFLLGDGVFETMRAEEGHPLFPADHFARLARGARSLGIAVPCEPEELLAWCEQVLDANGLTDARMRVTLTRGPVRSQPIAEREGAPALAVTATPLDPRLGEERAQGWRLAVAPHLRNERSPLASIKATSYLESLLARRYARAHGFDEALLLNTVGAVAEGAMANVFAVRDERISTPPAADGALPGTMRARILKLAAAAGWDAREESLSLEDLLAADEVFLTNAIMEVMPVVGIGERLVAAGLPGPAAKALQAAWRAEARKFLAARRQ